MKILITGCAGFIGSHLVDKFLIEKHFVVGLDNFNDYYDPRLKNRNVGKALKNKNFKLIVGDVLNRDLLENIFKKNKFDLVVHLAARAGVRPSIYDPTLYAVVNKIGTLNLLELSTRFKVKKFIFASSSSVYGNTKAIPFVETDKCISIVSPYGASKRATEFMLETFYKTYGLESVAIRFFTVYGPRGRPDMAPALFVKGVLTNAPIIKYGDGTTYRDYTFVDDIIHGIVKSVDIKSGFEIINLGNNSPVSLNEFLITIEKITKKKAMYSSKRIPNGDVKGTWANIEKAQKLLGWKPVVKIEEGLTRYIKWLKSQSN